MSQARTPLLIIGAGVAGLAAARELRSAGAPFVLAEKSRGLGGRAATRRWDHGPVDHGAQFFTARSPGFGAQVDDWLARGICFEWARGFHQWKRNALHPPHPDGHPRYACRAGMSALGRDLAGHDESSILRNERVVGLTAHASGWTAEFDSGRILTAEKVLITAPAPQAALLLREAAPAAAEALAAQPMSPCLALAARYSRLDVPWQAIQFEGHDVLSWAGHDTSKRPDLHPDSTILMLHATPGFSEAHYATPPEEVTPALLAALSEVSGHDWTRPSETFFHRWRYAQAGAKTDPSPPTSPFLSWQEPAPLLAAGDALGGGKIEGAWLSGIAAARHLLGR